MRQETPDEELHRILEYLDVPSPFAGTDVWASPTAAQNGSHAFHPPFNRISTYREPGRINLNTIYDPDVFKGLMAGGGTASINARWSAFQQSRRGDGRGHLGHARGIFADGICPPVPFLRRGDDDSNADGRSAETEV